MYAPTITRNFNAAIERATRGEDSGDQYSSDAWQEAIEEIYEEYNITCALHVLEDGFFQGDAGDEEINAHALQWSKETTEELLAMLTSALEDKYTAKLDAIEEKLQEEYNEE